MAAMNASRARPGRRDGRLIHRAHRPVPLADVLGLRALEVVDRPEDRQPSVGVGRAEAGQVCRVDHQHRVELEPDVGPRLDVAHAGQQQGGQHFLIAQPLLDPPGDLLEEPLARGVLQQPDDGLDLGLEPHDLRVQLGLVGRDRPEPRQEAQVAEAHQRTARRGRLQEAPSIRSHAHGCSCSQDGSCGSKTRELGGWGGSNDAMRRKNHRTPSAISHDPRDSRGGSVPPRLILTRGDLGGKPRDSRRLERSVGRWRWTANRGLVSLAGDFTKWQTFDQSFGGNPLEACRPAPSARGGGL